MTKIDKFLIIKYPGANTVYAATFYRGEKRNTYLGRPVDIRRIYLAIANLPFYIRSEITTWTRQP